MQPKNQNQSIHARVTRERFPAFAAVGFPALPPSRALRGVAGSARSGAAQLIIRNGFPASFVALPLQETGPSRTFAAGDAWSAGLSLVRERGRAPLFVFEFDRALLQFK